MDWTYLAGIAVALLAAALVGRYLVGRRSLGADRQLRVTFSDIPEPTRFALFDRTDPRSTKHDWELASGDGEVVFDLPSDWREPFYSLRGRRYFIPKYRGPISPGDEELLFSGADCYVDIDRERALEEVNRAVVEELTHKLVAQDVLSGRQKFYVSLVALQSHFEYLVHGMLVLSGHVSKGEFRKLKDHERQTEKAFHPDNTDFFSTTIRICPGKEGLGQHIDETQRRQMKTALDKIRTLRNRVVHGWGYKDLGRERLLEDLAAAGANVGHPQETDGQFYTQLAHGIVQLYARTHPLVNQLHLIIEREAVADERAARGYGRE